MALMTDSEKLTMVKSILGISDTTLDSQLTTYLTVAEKEIIAWRYSFGDEEVTDVPSEYEMTQVYAVVTGYSQSGAENQIRHSENGIYRVFNHSDMIEYIHANVIPLCKIL